MSQRIVYSLSLVSLVLVMASCGEEETDAPKYSEEQTLLVGDWEEQVKKDSLVNWKFTHEKVSCGNYTHYYIFEESKIVISGMDYKVVHQSEDTLDILSPEQVQIQLVRK